MNTASEEQTCGKAVRYCQDTAGNDERLESPGNQNLSLFYECTSVQAYTPENLFWCVVDGTSRRAAHRVVGPLPSVPLYQIIHWKRKLKVKLIIGLAIAVATIIAIGFIVLLFRLKTKSLSSLKSLYFHLTGRNDEGVEAFILQYGSLAPQRFSYSNIKKITNSFKDKLGQGGYGSVYKGELLDGRIVAVKVLRKSVGDGGDFINEVASISRTSHVNIVSLLGFCYERSKRALIYEFMHNGSLDKFICNKGSLENHQLAIKTLYEIALGIARGLEYLHRGCTTRILHFDIKPQNILLDANFCPKISDFGLAKLCETRDSIVSMTGARGTCGYIAPEVFCRNFGGVSYKSDVYSYGMMVLEMIGGRGKNANVEVSHSSEMSFATSLYKQLEKSEKLNLDRFIADDEEEMTRKMVVVSLWCIQTIPSNRPSMSTVLELLQGSLEALPFPPEPSLFSPAAIPLQNSNTTSSVIMQSAPSTFEATSLHDDDDDASSNT
ncbi:hypothetical protein SLEP1_g37768 [Rubroshorea leprosula]|uniref:Protein kinase domain-containing protein n=1 Tax=Rubroshorea leprosula TaxID=152421 RepID=A0AAV5KW02_9ROSI|nr:hypothetical protein SLEP1_g37768 [Rubroshorea leprosula]